mmetsp:Transcript_25772/g.42313  ORF Transcript_25772/g.42313 Transcript_25772/m.42313 type:complete len:210 (+) Transcript_25772:183-812(+)|eukprot:CAMPEP_0184663984 /NCGR_PEP_ID=MMETSP0308-20130426/50715_1 /TAXON_ID=38269 /ORGANISM="Gloeochaete witrockiana, Strain SAG 46.84" /LENGTH=209 /DNA_ID=CAMNT_0027107085 /DNA_START=181 /DNA_END=810 /DNA_ORIENTATION=+
MRAETASKRATSSVSSDTPEPTRSPIDQVQHLLSKVPSHIYVKFFIWAILFYAFVRIEFGFVYFLLSFFFVIVRWGLGQRNAGDRSAYSIFNPGCESLPGSLQASAFNLPGQPIYEDPHGIEERPRTIDPSHNTFRTPSGIGPEDYEDYDPDVWNDAHMSPPAVQDRKATKVKRNEACPCGSGLKFKKCCSNGDTLHKRGEEDVYEDDW